MKAHAQELVAVAARALAGKAHTEADLHEALYKLVIDISSPAQRELPAVIRRRPLAGEVLPPHQRVSWARGKTVFDVEDK
jgi:hypothetical protein